MVKRVFSIILLILISFSQFTACSSKQDINEPQASIENLSGTYTHKNSLGIEYFQITKDVDKFIISYAWLVSNTYNEYRKTEVSAQNIEVDRENNTITFSALFKYESKYIDGRTKPETEHIDFTFKSNNLGVKDESTEKLFTKEDFKYDLKILFDAKEISDQYMIKVYNKNNSSIRGFRYDGEFRFLEGYEECWFYYTISYDKIERSGYTKLIKSGTSFEVEGFTY